MTFTAVLENSSLFETKTEFTLSQAYLQLSGDHVWTFFERNVGQLAVNAFRCVCGSACACVC